MTGCVVSLAALLLATGMDEFSIWRQAYARIKLHRRKNGSGEFGWSPVRAGILELGEGNLTGRMGELAGCKRYPASLGRMKRRSEENLGYTVLYGRPYLHRVYLSIFEHCILNFRFLASRGDLRNGRDFCEWVDG